MENFKLTAEEARRLARFGYFEEQGISAYETEATIDESLKSANFENAIILYQEFFTPAINDGCMAFHGRRLDPDGTWGPASRAELGKPRCGHPDILPAGIEQGNWPDQCRNEITTSYQMELNGIEPSRLAELWRESHKKWNDVFDLQLVHKPNSYPNTRIYSSAARLGGSVLADQFLAISDCGFRSRGRFDSDRTWNEVLFVTTCTHEHGHALGAPHSNDPDATMYPSITQASMARRGAPNPSDREILRSLGYKERTTIPPINNVRGSLQLSNGQTIQLIGFIS